jgi:surfeit locus 1 family protein
VFVLRTALRPRWLALLGLVAVICVAFGWLGSWQLGVARDRSAERARQQVAARPPVPVDAVLVPQQPFTVPADGRLVTAGGRYDPSRQVLVAGRLQAERPGWWVVAALRAESGGWLPVVRGWVPDPDDARARPDRTPAGPVRVAGVLQPDEAPGPDGPGLGTGPGGPRLTALDAADLANRWGTPIYNGYLVLTRESTEPVGPTTAPPTTTQPAAARPELVPAPRPQPTGLVWRNAAYAVQWWVFAGFTVVLWWKMVQQDARERSPGRPGPDRSSTDRSSTDEKVVNG